MRLSIVTTLYNSAEYLPEFYRRASAAARQVTDDWEMVLVNDGSPDCSLEMALGLYTSDDHVRVIDLSRNFGHHKAMMTGLEHSRGELVFLLDADLEEAPELLEQFCRRMRETGADVVYGVQQRRKGGLFERLTGEVFYRLFNLLSASTVPRNAVTARLMTRRYVNSLVQHRDREVFLLGLWTITGYSQVPMVIEKGCKGTSSYTLRRKLTIFVNSVTSFSSKPLAYIFYLGSGISTAAGLAASYLVVRAVFFGGFLAGWASLIVSVWLLGGLMIFCLGIIGMYVSRIFTETKDRPYTVVRAVHDRRV